MIPQIKAEKATIRLIKESMLDHTRFISQQGSISK